VVYLNGLLERFEKKGFRIVALAIEEPDVLRDLFVREYTAKYWMGCADSLDLLLQFIRTNVVAEFPHHYLVDVEGKVACHGEETVDEKRVVALLADVFDPSLGRELHKKLAPAVRHYEQRAIGKAHAAAQKLTEDEDAVLAADAKYLCERCEEFARFERRKVEKLQRAQDYPVLIDALDDVRRRYQGMELSKWASARKRELNRDPQVRKAFRALAKRYPDTQAGAEARRRGG
jgi:hypothetical protein